MHAKPIQVTLPRHTWHMLADHVTQYRHLFEVASEDSTWGVTVSAQIQRHLRSAQTDDITIRMPQYDLLRMTAWSHEIARNDTALQQQWQYAAERLVPQLDTDAYAG